MSVQKKRLENGYQQCLVGHEVHDAGQMLRYGKACAYVWQAYRLGSLGSSVPDNSSQQGQLVHKAGSNALLHFPVLFIHVSHQPVTAAIAVPCTRTE